MQDSVRKDEGRLRNWERRAEMPLLVVAVVFLAAYAVPIVWPGVPGWTHTVLGLVVTGTWVLFAVEFAVRLWLAPFKRPFLRAHIIDVLLIVLPMFRPLRVLRVVLVLRVVHHRAEMGFRGRVVAYTVSSVALLGFLAALAVLDAERGHPDASIKDVGDAVWWALTTITTVGYGDYSPVTGEGQIAAALLMLAGIGLLGVVTGSLASWFVERLRGVEAAEEKTRAALREVLQEVRALHDRIDALDGTARPDEPSTTPSTEPSSGSSAASPAGPAGPAGPSREPVPDRPADRD